MYAESDTNFIVPVWDTLPDVQVMGVYRLRYHPRTALTAEWVRKGEANAQQWKAFYSQLAGKESI